MGGLKEWVDGWISNVVKGGARVYEAYEVK